MNFSPRRIATVLLYLGTVPFFVCVFFLLFGKMLGLGLYRPLAAQAIISYAAIVVSFLGGIQWGIGISTMEQQPHTARSLFLLSIVPSLLAWAMLFLPVSTARIIVAIFLVGFVWIIDSLLHLQQVIPDWFYRLRSIISCVILGALIAALVAG